MDEVRTDLKDAHTTDWLISEEFESRCKGFYDLCSGLLKLHNICGPSSDMVQGHVGFALDAFQKIVGDFIGANGESE